MAIAKVILNGDTLMDVTSNTVNEDSLKSGYTATKNDGTEITGTIVSKSSTDLTVSGATVTAPAGYYSSSASKSVATATHPKPTASINTSTGVVTASHTQSTGYVTGGTTTSTLSLSTQAEKTVTPTESSQTAVAKNVYTTGVVTVGAISSTYVGSEISQRGSSDLTVSGAKVTVPAGYYASAVSKSIVSGTAGTPSASKGTVSNNSVTVTPSVTNTTGYITGGTKTGTGVSVNASELVSGTLDITENGNADVTNYANVDVNVDSEPELTALTVTPSLEQQVLYSDGDYFKLVSSGKSTSGTSMLNFSIESDTHEFQKYIPYEVYGSFTIKNSDNSKVSIITLNGTEYVTTSVNGTSNFSFPFTYSGDDLISSICIAGSNFRITPKSTSNNKSCTVDSDIAIKTQGIRNSVFSAEISSDTTSGSYDSTAFSNGDMCAVSGIIRGSDRDGSVLFIPTMDEIFVWDGNTHSFNILYNGSVVATCEVTTSSVSVNITASARMYKGGINVSKYSRSDGYNPVTVEPTSLSIGTFQMKNVDNSLGVGCIALCKLTGITDYVPISLAGGNSSYQNYKWLLSSDGYMYVTFYGTNDSFWPVITADSGTVEVVKTIDSGNMVELVGESGYYRKSGCLVFCKVSNNAILRLSYKNNN